MYRHWMTNRSKRSDGEWSRVAYLSSPVPGLMKFLRIAVCTDPCVPTLPQAPPLFPPSVSIRWPSGCYPQQHGLTPSATFQLYMSASPKVKV
mmetsp:Transcript_101440/g.175224  ORF Transcript_101440/g.175224 Transcript_101440/m.175224 type:complete len:92 (+) Transcript_101440:2802-3077(+)